MKAILTAVLTLSILISSYVVLHAYEENHHVNHEHGFAQVTVEKFLAELNEMPAMAVSDLWDGGSISAVAPGVEVNGARRDLGVPDWAETR